MMADENDSLEYEAMQLAEAFGDTAKEGGILERFRTSADPADVASAIVEWTSHKPTIKAKINTFGDIKLVTCKTHGGLKFMATSVSTDVWLKREGEELVVAIRPSQESGAGSATAATGLSVVLTGGIAPVLGVGYHAWVKSKMPNQLMEVVRDTAGRMPHRPAPQVDPPSPTRSENSVAKKKVDPNTARIPDFETAGFARHVANRIVEAREHGGLFGSIPELLARTGLGPHEISCRSALLFLSNRPIDAEPAVAQPGAQQQGRRRDIF